MLSMRSFLTILFKIEHTHLSTYLINFLSTTLTTYYIIYLFILFIVCLSTRMWGPHRTWICLFYSFLYPLHLEQYLVLSRCSTNIYQINVWIFCLFVNKWLKRAWLKYHLLHDANIQGRIAFKIIGIYTSICCIKQNKLKVKPCTFIKYFKTEVHKIVSHLFFPMNLTNLSSIQGTEYYLHLTDKETL